MVSAVAVFFGVFLLLKARGAGAEFTRQVMGEGSGNVIVMGRDEAGRLNEILMIVPGPDDSQSVYVIPARTVAETPDAGFQSLDRVLELGGQEMLDQTVANLLQVPVQYHISYGGNIIDSLVEQAGSINFKSNRAFSMSTAAGPVSFNPGDNMAGSQLALSWYKGSFADPQTGPEVQAMFFRGLRDALAAKPESDRGSFAGQLAGRLETDLDESAFADLYVNATNAGSAFGVWALPVQASGGGADWYYEPVLDQLDALMSGSPTDTSFNMEIQNGTQVAGVAEAAAERLSSLKYNVTLKTETSGVNYDYTQIRTGSEALLEGNRVHDMLGAGTLIKDDNLEKKQIIVIIGKDLDLIQLERR